jgi:NAD(P)-dependent dehydrogenase (short-subunit alcohol dehydrogenase family)
MARAAPDRVEVVQMDVTDPAQVTKAVAQAIGRFGQIDVLVNNAGFAVLGAVEETPLADVKAQMETNFFGAVSVTRAVLPQMRKQGSGAIVNISSLGGQLSFAGFSAYSASKFALEGMSEALATEVNPLGIKVLIVEPGQFRTEFAGAGMRKMPEIDAYKDTVGATRNFAEGMHGTQAGDPLKAAKAIDTALKAEKTPLRLVLGGDAVDAIKGHAETLLADMRVWEETSLDTRLD